MTDDPLKAEELREVSKSSTIQADTPVKAERLAEIAQMADLLTDHLLSDQIEGRAVSKEGIAALLKASSLLKDYGYTIPPLLNQIVQDVGDEDGTGSPEGRDKAESDDAERLAWSLRPFQGSDAPKA